MRGASAFVPARVGCGCGRRGGGVAAVGVVVGLGALPAYLAAGEDGDAVLRAAAAAHAFLLRGEAHVDAVDLRAVDQVLAGHAVAAGVGHEVEGADVVEFHLVAVAEVAAHGVAEGAERGGHVGRGHGAGVGDFLHQAVGRDGLAAAQRARKILVDSFVVLSNVLHMFMCLVYLSFL